MNLEAHGVTPGIPFGKRVQGILATGVLSSIVAAVGDFLSPAGGWMALVVVGAASVAGAALILVTRGRNSVTHWLSRRDAELAQWWQGPVLFQHGLHVTAIFSIVCLAVGVRSFELAPAGGILASDVPALARIQVMTGMLEEQRRTTAAVEELSRVVKRETSDDPRKELMNRGIPWSDQSFGAALSQGDLPTVELFLRGGFDPVAQEAFRIQLSGFFEGPAWSRKKPLLILLRDSGIDFIADFPTGADGRGQMFPVGWTHSTPLGVSLRDGSDEPFEWLIENHGRNGIEGYEEVAGMLVPAAEGCSGNRRLEARIRQLSDRGLDLSQDTRVYVAAYSRWFQLKHRLPPLGTSSMDEGEGLAACERALALLSPVDTSLRESLRQEAMADAKRGQREQLASEVDCIEDALASEWYEGDVLPRTYAAKDGEQVPYRCGPISADNFSYTLTPAGTLRARKVAIEASLAALEKLGR